MQFQVQNFSGIGITISGFPVIQMNNNVNTGFLTGLFYPLYSNPAGYVASTAGGTSVQVSGSLPFLTGANLVGISGITLLLSGNSIFINGGGITGQGGTGIGGGAQQFCGVSSNTTIASPPTSVLSTLTQSIGVGHNSTDTNLMLYYGGSVAQTPISLSPNFPINTLSLDVYEMVLFAPSNVNNVCYYEVTNINSGISVTGILSGTAGTVLPASTALLTYSKNWRYNNGNALAVGLDIMSDYIETDN